MSKKHKKRTRAIKATERTIVKTGNESANVISETLAGWVASINGYLRVLAEASEKKTECLATIAKMDHRTQEILHGIEICKDLNVVDGYRAYKLLKEMRIARRIAKNELLAANILTSENLDLDQLKAFGNRIAGLNTCKYTFDEYDPNTIGLITDD